MTDRDGKIGGGVHFLIFLRDVIYGWPLTPSGRKRLDTNILPTLNLPVKSCETKKPPERSTLVREPLPIPITDDKCYSSLNDMNRRISNLKMLPWTYRACDNITYLELNIRPYLIPKYIIKIDESLDFNLLIYNWPLPDDHFIYKMYRRSFRNVFISPMLKNINDLVVCAGVKHPLESSKVLSVPIEVNEDDFVQSPRWKCIVLHHVIY